MNLVTSSIVSAIILLFIPCLLLQTNSITVVAAFSPSHLLIGSACSTTLAKSLHQREEIRLPLLSAILQKKKMMMKKKNENGDDDDSSSSTNTDGANVGKRRQNQRRPSSSWDILRFVSQSSKFIRPPSLLLIPQIFIRGGVGVLADKNKRRIGSGMYLFCGVYIILYCTFASLACWLWFVASRQNQFMFCPTPLSASLSLPLSLS